MEIYYTFKYLKNWSTPMHYAHMGGMSSKLKQANGNKVVYRLQ
jgi:hypothetical protein